MGGGFVKGLLEIFGGCVCWEGGRGLLSVCWVFFGGGSCWGKERGLLLSGSWGCYGSGGFEGVV